MKSHVGLLMVLLVSLGSGANGQSQTEIKNAAYCIGVIDVEKSSAALAEKDPGLIPSITYSAVRQRLEGLEQHYRSVIQDFTPALKPPFKNDYRAGVEAQKICDATRALCVARCAKREDSADETKLCVSRCYQIEECRSPYACYQQ